MNSFAIVVPKLIISIWIPIGGFLMILWSATSSTYEVLFDDLTTDVADGTSYKDLNYVFNRKFLYWSFDCELANKP
jgi:hypothetical protein